MNELWEHFDKVFNVNVDERVVEDKWDGDEMAKDILSDYVSPPSYTHYWNWKPALPKLTISDIETTMEPDYSRQCYRYTVTYRINGQAMAAQMVGRERDEMEMKCITDRLAVLMCDSVKNDLQYQLEKQFTEGEK